MLFHSLSLKNMSIDISKQITSQKCAVLHIGNVEVDHKD